MNIYQFTICLVASSLLAVYIAINSYIVVKFRSKNYLEDESLRCYWAYWTDWLAFFWIDMIMNIRFVKKKVKKIDRKIRRKIKEKKKEKHLKKKVK